MTKQQMQFIKQGCDLLRVPQTSKIPLARGIAELAEDQREYCDHFVRQCGLRGAWKLLKPKVKEKPFEADGLNRHDNPVRQMLSLPFRFVSEIVDDAPIRFTSVVQDKDPSICWTSSLFGYALRLRDQIQDAHTRWRIVDRPSMM